MSDLSRTTPMASADVLATAPERGGRRSVKIVEAEAIPLAMAFVPEVAPHMLRATTHGTAVTLVRVKLADGVEGYGDDLGPAADVSGWVGRSALDGVHGARQPGLEMACVDAVGRALGVPAHTLMGRHAQRRVPFAYWTIDLPPETLAQQVRRAVPLGHAGLW